MNLRTITSAGAALRAGEISCAELIESVIERADKFDPELGTFIYRCNEAAHDAARDADRELRSGIDRGPLHGIPIGIKDIVATRDCPTTAQSELLLPSWPYEGDAPVVRILREAGAIVTGKTTTMEFAMGLPDPSKPFPLPRNPWDRSKWTGGSSSGTASGIAAGMFLGGVGTDTGGSIRSPAAWCGITGLKPTFGLVPKTGVVPLAPDIDHVGPMARTARDCALLLEAMAAYDPADSTSLNWLPGRFSDGLDGSLLGIRVGVEREHHTGAPGVEPAAERLFEAAVQILSEAGAEIVEVSIPDYHHLISAATVLILANAFALHRDLLHRRWDDYGRHTRVGLAIGALYRASDFAQARRVRDAVGKQVLKILDAVDLIVTLTAGSGPPSLEGLDLTSGMSMPIFCPAWSALGLPALSIPIGLNDAQMPIGMQLVGGRLADRLVLRAGDAYQQRTAYHLLEPPILTRAAL
jgi:aspartyl-tRNA(Asn)/glutamyl-tRNA(Gln) amidotransferase subunit A